MFTVFLFFLCSFYQCEEPVARGRNLRALPRGKDRTPRGIELEALEDDHVARERRLCGLQTRVR